MSDYSELARELMYGKSLPEQKPVVWPEEWIHAYLNPECFYCGVELPLNEITKTELPHERMCDRCYAKEAEDTGADL